MRRKTREIRIGNLKIGAENPVLVQTMANTETKNVGATVSQILRLKEAGCELVRLAVPDKESAAAIYEIKNKTGINLVADIHFDYKLALLSAEAGADKIRINPGNIGAKERVFAVADECNKRKIPIRIGVNSGSVSKALLAKYGRPSPDAIVLSARENIKMLEDCGFYDIVVSMKSSSVGDTVECYRKLAGLCDYPFHIGVTEAGTERMGIIKSAAGIGALLIDGIGDTLRVSLTAPPEKEIRAANDILKAVGLNSGGVNIISCPTCGRTKIDLIGFAEKVEKAFEKETRKFTVAVMGCAVNGPGEAKEADIGIAGGDGFCLLFKKGEILEKLPEAQALDRLLEYAKEL